MGDPRKLRKKYSTPTHPWQKLRIEDEKALMKEYGFKNKAEVWKLNSKLRSFKTRVKELIPKKDEVSEMQKKNLLEKLHRYKLIQQNAILEDILALTLKDMCERRLQTIVFIKGLSRSIKQARQFIVHEHIIIGERKITSPSYLVTAEEEALVTFSSNSSLFFEDHSERIPKMAIVKEEQKIAGLKSAKEEKVKGGKRA